MPLLTKDRIQIPLSQRAIPANPLPVPQIPQREIQQCWAACVDMVLDYLREPDIRQCEIADRSTQTAEGCCNAPSSSLCNRPLKDNEITRLWESYDIRPDYVDRDVTFEIIQEEIRDKRPVEVGLTFTLSGPRGHVVIVRGWDEDATGRYVFVNDPNDKRGQGRILFSELQNAYGDGEWDATWTKLGR